MLEVQTWIEASVFAARGSKAGLLVAVVGAAARRPADEAPLPDRTEWRDLAQEKDGARAIDAFLGLYDGPTPSAWYWLDWCYTQGHTVDGPTVTGAYL